MPPERRRAAIVEASIPPPGGARPGLTLHGRRAAGVAEGTIFHVFDSLDDLISRHHQRALSSAAHRPPGRVGPRRHQGPDPAPPSLIEQYLHSGTLHVHRRAPGREHTATPPSAPAPGCSARTAETDLDDGRLRPHRDHITIPLQRLRDAAARSPSGTPLRSSRRPLLDDLAASRAPRGALEGHRMISRLGRLINRYIRPYWGLLSIVIVLQTIATIMSLYLPT